MYLTVHRVRSPKGARGINAVLYTHAGTDLPTEAWSLEPRELVRVVSEEHPGRRRAAMVNVAPGGNNVESLLDIVAPDDTALPELQQALDAARDALDSSTLVFSHYRSVIRFGVNLGNANPQRAFDELGRAALDLFAAPGEPWVDKEPVVVQVIKEHDYWVFLLDPNSEHRVRAVGGQPARIRVQREVANDFRKLQGPLYPHVAQWVTNLTGEQLLELGGASFTRNGLEVGRWPAASG